MGLTLITPAAALPVTLAEAKAWARVDASADNPVLEMMLAAAAARVEELSGCPLGEQGWQLTLDDFSDTIELPRSPVSAVDSFEYLDADGALQSVDGAIYSLDLTSAPQWVVRNSEADWPEVLDAVNAVTLTFTAGYSAATLPASLKRAVLVLTTAWFDDRSNCDVPAGVHDAISAFRPWQISA